jgi:hypothetical protein
MGFGVRQFELALMHRMRDLNPVRVEEALGHLGASRAELRAAHTTWTRMAHSARAPRGRAGLRAVLGRPSYEGTTEFGSLTCEVARWRLPSWPELEFEALTGPGGELWNQWFVRPGGHATLSFADLTPWTCVIGDVQASFPDSTPCEGSAPHHWAVDFTCETGPHRALFVYGLYQRLA